MNEVAGMDAACLARDIGRAVPARATRTEGPIRVLFVEDDPNRRELLVNKLARSGFAAWSFADSASLLGALGAGVDADFIIVFDGGLSKTSGIDVLPLLRRHRVDLPVIMLTDLLAAQESRASDGRAIGSPPDKSIACSRLVLKADMKRAYWDGVDVGLTRGEYDMVDFMASNTGRFVTYRAIYDRLHYQGFIAGNGTDGYRANVRSAIKRIRNKFRALDATFAEIETYMKFGYRWGKPRGAA